MTQKVLLDEGGYANVHTRIKDMCKVARNSLGLTNQQICDLISERFNIEDFSVNTVNNFFSERSKATTIYTTGYICAVLNISIDAVFKIKNDLTSERETEYLRELAHLSEELRHKEDKISSLEQLIKEKDERIAQAHSGLEYYRNEASKSSRKVQPWVFTLTVILLVAALLFITIYLLAFDINNPNYGIFRSVFNFSYLSSSIKGLLSI